jgi:hypothetical protein
VFEFSAQTDHLHLLVEADDPTRFERGMRGLTIRIAKAVNRALGRVGRVWGDRFSRSSPANAPRDAECVRLRAQQLAKTSARSSWIGCKIIGRVVFGMEDAGERPRQISGSPRADVARNGRMATGRAAPRRTRSAEKTDRHVEMS